MKHPFTLLLPRRLAMPAKSVRAVRREDGAFEAAEPIEIPDGALVEVRVYELPRPVGAGRSRLPVFPGTVFGALRRADLYADR